MSCANQHRTAFAARVLIAIAFASVLAWCPGVAFADAEVPSDDAADNLSASVEAADVAGDDEGLDITNGSGSSADGENVDTSSDTAEPVDPNDPSDTDDQGDPVEPSNPGDSDDPDASADSDISTADDASAMSGDAPGVGKVVSDVSESECNIASACNGIAAYQFGEADMGAWMLEYDGLSGARAIGYVDQVEDEAPSGEENQAPASETPSVAVPTSDSATNAPQVETPREPRAVMTKSHRSATSSSAMPCVDESAYQVDSEAPDLASELDDDEPLAPKQPLSPSSPAPTNPAPPAEPGGPAAPASLSSAGSHAGSAQQLGDAAVTPDSASLHAQRLSLRARGFVSEKELPRHGGFMRCRSPSMS